MASEFSGAAHPLDDEGLHAALALIKVGLPELWAVVSVETSGCGYLPSKRPQILFERHVFSRETGGRYDAAHPDISNPVAGGYGAGGEAQYARLQQALALDRAAALHSTSWGIGQIMGYNAVVAGFAGAEEMVQSFCESENSQLLAMARFLVRNTLDRPLQKRDWKSFARGYNGPSYQKNSYDTRLAANYAKFRAGALPDLTVRAAQLYLVYLGRHPGAVDGIIGRLTLSALNDFQRDSGLQPSEGICAAEVEALRKAVEASSL